MKNPNRFFLFLFALFFLFSGNALAEKLTVFHTSDIHGYYFSRPDEGGNPFGGFAALQTLLKQEKTPFLLLDSGDFSSGNKEANNSDGLYSIELMNLVGKQKNNIHGSGYAALTIGNHDSDFGDLRLGKTLSHFKGDILSFNIENLNIPGKSVLPYQIYAYKRLKIAIIGFSLNGPGMSGMRIKTANAALIRQTMQAVLAQKPNAIIFLAHDSIGDARKPSNVLGLLSSVPEAKENIDLFLGGHAHIKKVERKLGENGPLFVESGAMLEGTSKITLDFDEGTGQLKTADAQYIKLEHKHYKENRKIRHFLRKIEDQSLQRVYAYVPKLISKYPAGEDSSAELGKMMADEMYAWLAPIEPVDLALFTIPAVRKDIAPGNMTGRDVVEIFPYAEYVSTFDILGSHLKKVIQASIKQDERYGSYSLFAYSDNVRISYQLNKDKNHSVQLRSITINGQEIQPQKIYRVASIAHLPDGYYEGAPFKGNPIEIKKKIYQNQSSSGLFFNIVINLPKNKMGVAQFNTPGDVRIKRLPSSH